MAYFCLSHNHNDFHDIASYVISKTLSYTDAVLNKSDVSSPYKKWAVHIDAKSQTDFNALSNKSTWLSGRNDLMEEDTSNAITGFLWSAYGDKSNSVYGDIHWNGGIDDSQTIDTTTYDNIVAVSNSKVIHLTWSDFTHSSFATTFKDRCDTMDTGNVISDWDERLNTYKVNLEAITYPTSDDNFVLYQDKLLDKDEAHYTSLCTFLGATELTSSTWKGYIDAYNTHLSS
tara:strand:- start:2586 stop:3275 length:690 start_codon:yes stop_codon:yes gene_type:complete